jgi:hypothetical protein
MLMPRSHAWTPARKSLIIAAALLAIAVVCAAVYSYERYYRGPGEEAFYGTWQDFDFFSDEPVYFDFRPDNTFFIAGTYEGELNPFARGRWFAGGPHLYLRFAEDPYEGNRPRIAHILKISEDEIAIRWSREPASKVTTWKRTHFAAAPREASNQAMQRTASKAAIDVRCVCHPRFGCESRLPGLAAADLVVR